MQRTPVLICGTTTPHGTGGISTWLVSWPEQPDGEPAPTAEQTGALTLGDASWVTPVGDRLAVMGERDHHLWLVRPGDSPTVEADLDLVGGEPCHAALDPTGRILAVAHYGSGEVSLVDLDSWGRPPHVLTRCGFEGHGPIADRQAGAHAHHILWLDRTHLALCDLGSDLVRILRLSDAGLEQVGELRTPAGLGPRHAVLRRDGGKQVLTVTGELSGSVHSWSRPAGEDAWARQWRPVVETPTSRQPGAVPSGLVPGPDGTLLVANRGTGTLGVLRGRFGRLTLTDEIPLSGRDPRDLTSDRSRVWVADQAEGTVECLTLGEDGARRELVLAYHGASRVLVGPTLG